MRQIFQLIHTELRGAWRYRWTAMLTAWGVCVVGWLFVFTLPDIYEAEAQVYVDADSRLADVMSDVGVTPEVSSRVFVVRQAMLGRPQLERVARETDLDLRAPTLEDKERLILGLRGKHYCIHGQISAGPESLHDHIQRSRPTNGFDGGPGIAGHVC